MNLRLKSFVSIQFINNKNISVSGCVGKDLLFDYNDFNFSLLQSLMSKDGVCLNEYVDSDLFQQLKENGLLEDATSCSAKRNESFYQYANLDIHSARQKKILILGAGAAGGTISYLLAQQGFKHIACFDDDKVESGDVEKTMVYNESDIGEYKVDALWKRIQSNFHISITREIIRLSSIDEASGIIKNYFPDLIVYAIDPNPSFKLNFNKLCLSLHIPIIHASYSYEKIICGPCVIPGKTACMIGYNEYWRRRTNGEFDFYNVSKFISNRLKHPSISFNINTLSSIILKDIIFCLGGKFENVSTLNRMLIINLLTSEIIENELSCKFCTDCTIKSDC